MKILCAELISYTFTVTVVLLFFWNPNFMGQSPSWEVNSASGSQDIPNF
jgi:hypothetical protein